MPYLLVLPAVLFCVIWRAVPLLMVAGLSLFESDFLSTTWIGLRHYGDILSNHTKSLPIVNMVWYVLLIVPGTLVLSLSVAMTAVRSRHPHLWRFLWYVPSLVSGLILSTVWRWIFHYDGIVNWIAGVEVMWFSTRLLSVVPISIIQTVMGAGFFIIIFMAALKAIPVEHYETAKLEGATPGQERRLVMWPQILPTAGLVIILVTALSLQLWGWIYMLAPYPYAETLMYAVFREGFLFGRFGVASAYSVLLMVATVGVIVIQRRIRRWT